MAWPSEFWKDFPDISTQITAATLRAREEAGYAYTDSELSNHEADTTSVHGISDTSLLVTSSNVDDIVVCTQATYNGLTPNSRTLYVISG